MLYSMTGFNRVRREYPWGTLALEISSVNSRYLEVSIRSDRDLSGFEPLLQNTLRSRLSRGKVVLRAEIKWAASMMTCRLNCEVLSDYYRQLSEMQSALGGRELALSELLSLPGVTESGSFLEKATGEVQPALTELLGECIDGLIKMRGVEGEALASDVGKNLDEYAALIEKISTSWQKISQDVFAAYREKVTKNISQLGYESDPARLAQELAILADKWDISEELTRSKSHVGQFKKMLGGDGAVGRKLDFLVQEMNREINTMGSKSASTELRWLVVDGKTLLERIREQIQNIE